jgi:hypothetical protein
MHLFLTLSDQFKVVLYLGGSPLLTVPSNFLLSGAPEKVNLPDKKDKRP